MGNSVSLLESIYRFFGWWIINIDLLLILILLLGAGLYWFQRKKCGKRLLILSCSGLVFLGIVPVGLWSFEMLENRFPKTVQIPSDVKGMILLGGPYDILTSLGRGERAYNLTFGRFTQFIDLAKKNPHFQLVFTGNEFENTHSKEDFQELGVDPSHVHFAEPAKNTMENAAKTAQLLKPTPDEKWLLVTSAYHMPRSVGLFRKAGFNVIPYPVDYHAPGKYEMSFLIGLKTNLEAWNAVAREWLGMIGNYIAGQSDEFYPRPSQG
jgi:uncharacterized SAM-binding protein YcdF (DUF218 family)